MGKKREARLRVRIDGLIEVLERNRVKELERQAELDQRTHEASLELQRHPFTIVTRSGKALRGRADFVEARCEPIDVTIDSIDSARRFIPGPVTRSASITIEPIQ